MRRILCCSIAIAALVMARADAKPFCALDRPPQSLLDVFFEADIVAVGRFQNGVAPNNALPNGQIEVRLDEVLVPHAKIKGVKTIVMPQFREAGKGQFLYAMEIYKGNIEIYHGTALDAQGEVVRYLRSGLRLKDKSRLGRARHAVDFLLSPNEEVARSAHIEIARASSADLRKVAESLSPEPFVKALQDAKTSPACVAAYAMLLGHCGKKEHASVLAKRIDDKKLMESSAADALLLAYVLLDRDNGWPLLVKTIEKKDASFLARYSALQAARQIYKYRRDVIERKKCAAAIASLLDVPDFADFVVEDFRKWQRWEYGDTILSLPAMPGLDAPIIRKSVLRFALQCPTQSAKNYVNAARLADPDEVADNIELLALEADLDHSRKK